MSASDYSLSSEMKRVMYSVWAWESYPLGNVLQIKLYFNIKLNYFHTTEKPS